MAEAAEYAAAGRTAQWIDAFLRGPAENEAFADGLKLQHRYWLGPVKVKRHYLERCCGPEAHMEYVMPADSWRQRTAMLGSWIREGWDMPPVIGQLQEQQVSVRDGNHRLGALEQLGVEDVWVFVWNDHGVEPLQQWLAAVEGNHYEI